VRSWDDVWTYCHLSICRRGAGRGDSKGDSRSPWRTTPAFNCLRVAAATKLDGELAGQESAFALDAYGEWGGGVEV
jgi:hypothetical protein